MIVLVYRNDGIIIGPFADEDAAWRWAQAVPNRLFETEEQYNHADSNSDMWTATLDDTGGSNAERRESAQLLADELLRSCHRLAPSEDGYEAQELATRLVATSKVVL